MVTLCHSWSTNAVHSMTCTSYIIHKHLSHCLTAANDTLSPTGLLYSLSKNMLHWFVQLVELLYMTDASGCIFVMTPVLGEVRQVDFIRGRVLSPTLCNLYSNDIPVTGSTPVTYLSLGRGSSCM